MTASIIFDGPISVALWTVENAVRKGYSIDPITGVVTAPRGNELKAAANKRTGYLEVMLPGPKYSVRTPVHKFQAYMKFGRAAFQGNSLHVRHLDDSKSNNSLENMGLGTPSQNWQDMPSFLRSYKSKAGGNALTQQQRRDNGRKAWKGTTPDERKQRMKRVRGESD